MSESPNNPQPRGATGRGTRRRWAMALAAGAGVTGLTLGFSGIAGAASSPPTANNSQQHRARPAAMGKVASVGSNSFTLTKHDGTTVTVDVSSSTTYHDRGSSSASLSNVTVGTRVAVFGTTSSGTVNASQVAIGVPDHPRGPGHNGPPAAVGKVASVGSNSFTLTKHDGTTVTVDVSSSTTYHDRGSSSASLSNVTVGTRVAVFGTTSSGTVNASQVAIGVPDHPMGPGRGNAPGPSGQGGSANHSSSSPSA